MCRSPSLWIESTFTQSYASHCRHRPSLSQNAERIWCSDATIESAIQSTNEAANNGACMAVISVTTCSREDSKPRPAATELGHRLV